MTSLQLTPAGERLRAAAAAMRVADTPRARVALYDAIRDALGDDLARWSRRELGFPMEPDEVAAALWTGLMSPGPTEECQIERLASVDTVNPVGWLRALATRQPVGCSAGWLRRDGGHALERTANEDTLAVMSLDDCDPYDQLDVCLTPVPEVLSRLLEALLPRTPEPMRASVTAALRWMVHARIDWYDTSQYIRDLRAAVPALEEDQARNLIGVVWGSKKRPDMSLFNLFRWHAEADLVDHGAAYRSAATYMQLMHGWIKRRGVRSAA